MATISLKEFSGGAPIKPIGNETQPETKKNMFVEEFIKRPVRSTIARPASRFGEMVGALGLKGIDKLTGGKVDEYVRKNSGMSLEEKLAQSIAKDKEIPGLGTVSGMKGFGQGGGKQIAGEGLEAGADILSMTGGTSAVGQTLKGSMKNAAITGFKTGAGAGFGYGSGFALQEGQSVLDSLLGGFAGASIGGPVGAGLGATFPLVGAGVNKLAGSKVAKTLVEATGNKIKNFGDAAFNPANIMQRVARIPKSQQQKFQNEIGETVGEYLTKRNIYGDVPDITDQLFKNFTASKQMADDSLAKLPGTYSPAPAKVALQELLERETKISPKGVPSKDLARVQELSAKMESKGLSMEEINEVKRLYERNVKTGYFKENNSDAIARSTNIDSSLREWQFKEAESLGFKNLADINMETKAAKQLMDALGKEYYGTAGNNALGLTDYILLSGGDPQAVSMFLSKKVFGNKKFQSAIAKKLAGESDFKVTPDIAEKEVLGLPAGDATRNTIKVAPAGANMESVDKLFIVPGQTKKQAPQLEKEGIPSVNNTTPVDKKNMPILERSRLTSEKITDAFRTKAMSGQLEDMRLNSKAKLDKYAPDLAGKNPGQSIKIYRASTSKIKPGDFITTDEQNALRYVSLREGSEVNSIVVQIRDLIKSDGLQNEFVYVPKTK